MLACCGSQQARAEAAGEEDAPLAGEAIPGAHLPSHLRLPKKLDKTVLEGIEARTNLGPKEIKDLYKRFRKIAPDGSLPFSRFCDTLGVLGMVDETFLAERLFNAFDTNGDSRLSFTEFAVALGIMMRGSDDEKLDLSFKILNPTYGGVATCLADYGLDSDGDDDGASDGERSSAASGGRHEGQRSALASCASMSLPGESRTMSLRRYQQLRSQIERDAIGVDDFVLLIQCVDQTRKALIGGSPATYSGHEIRMIFMQNATRMPDGSFRMMLLDFKNAVRTSLPFLALLGVLPQEIAVDTSAGHQCLPASKTAVSSLRSGTTRRRSVDMLSASARLFDVHKDNVEMMRLELRRVREDLDRVLDFVGNVVSAVHADLEASDALLTQALKDTQDEAASSDGPSGSVSQRSKGGEDFSSPVRLPGADVVPSSASSTPSVSATASSDGDQLSEFPSFAVHSLASSGDDVGEESGGLTARVVAGGRQSAEKPAAPSPRSPRPGAESWFAAAHARNEPPATAGSSAATSTASLAIATAPSFRASARSREVGERSASAVELILQRQANIVQALKQLEALRNAREMKDIVDSAATKAISRIEAIECRIGKVLALLRDDERNSVCSHGGFSTFGDAASATSRGVVHRSSTVSTLVTFSASSCQPERLANGVHAGGCFAAADAKALTSSLSSLYVVPRPRELGLPRFEELDATLQGPSAQEAGEPAERLVQRLKLEEEGEDRGSEKGARATFCEAEGIARSSTSLSLCERRRRERSSIGYNHGSFAFTDGGQASTCYMHSSVVEDNEEAASLSGTEAAEGDAETGDACALPPPPRRNASSPPRVEPSALPRPAHLGATFAGAKSAPGSRVNASLVNTTAAAEQQQRQPVGETADAARLEEETRDEFEEDVVTREGVQRVASLPAEHAAATDGRDSEAGGTRKSVSGYAGFLHAPLTRCGGVSDAGKAKYRTFTSKKVTIRLRHMEPASQGSWAQGDDACSAAADDTASVRDGATAAARSDDVPLHRMYMNRPNFYRLARTGRRRKRTILPVGSFRLKRASSNSSRYPGGQKGLAVHFGHENWDTVINIMVGIRLAAGRASSEPRRAIERYDFVMKEKFSILPNTGMVDRANGRKSLCAVRFVDYAPMVFRRLRERFQISSETYVRSVGPEQLLGNLLLGNLSSLSELVSEGRSGALFYYTADGKFMIKTISKDTAMFLRSILLDYYEHVMANPDTLLTRFFGLHAIRLKDKTKGSVGLPHHSSAHRLQKTYFIVMLNFFHTPVEIHRRYDLKGSSYKRQLPPDQLKDSTVALKDLDMDREGEKMELGPERRERILGQMQGDVDFLRSHQILDYSLLLGIFYRDRETEEVLSSLATPTVSMPPRRLPGLTHSSRMPFLSGVSHPPSEPHVPFFQSDFGGMWSPNKSKLYYVGMIDVLTYWSTRKKLEHAFKTVQTGDPKGISCVSPDYYAERFMDFMRRHIT
ncbi:hypothetical protein BESB_010680 [Besnoitia besnoiti]|uniref:Phosphatidylinositol-4-phosphate 5-kinase n=1 Tax=Besnoitia besnoiti TaxID=94643 RepID=A0A2A9MQD0_BESBE|nr:hypothetical protein BESB_010680 [Besnoitia besnoiti]PFH38726.1 hypothetical protein BESB_010680 [Besnoitia besnoiti]